jgi:hypothetical protein
MALDGRSKVRARKRLTLLISWTDAKVTATGISTTKVDRNKQFFNHRWQPFAGIGAPDQTKGVTLPPGNYEWPFELMLEGDTTESVEGLREASITYKLKATVARGKLAHDLHAYKRLRVIRTLEASALEFLHAMSVENIWPNKLEYSIVVPQKAVVFGSSIPVEMRFTPLLKGLELGDITIKLLEVHDVILQIPAVHGVKEHKKEKQIDEWTIPVTRDEHWVDFIDDNGQEGWVVNQFLALPKKLGQCLQDVNTLGIKVRHRLKLVVAIVNPDGHVSELRATLPVTIFISPNMPLDDQGAVVRQMPSGASREAMTAMAPPTYTERVLDQIYEDIEPTSLQTPIGGRSGVSSPLRGHSRVGSSENLAAMAMFHGAAVSPALLSSRLQNMSLEEGHRNSSWNSNLSAAGAGARTGSSSPHPNDSTHISPSVSTPLTRHNSAEESSGSNTPEHIDYPDLSELSKVPSYQTAIRTPARSMNFSDGPALPNYQEAMSTPGSPQLGGTATPPISDTLDTITEGVQQEVLPSPLTSPDDISPLSSRRPTLHGRQHSTGFQFPNVFHMHGAGDERRRLRLLQSRQQEA